MLFLPLYPTLCSFYFAFFFEKFAAKFVMFCFMVSLLIALLKYSYCFMTQLTHLFIPYITFIYICLFFTKDILFSIDFIFFWRVCCFTKVEDYIFTVTKAKFKLTRSTGKALHISYSCGHASEKYKTNLQSHLAGHYLHTPDLQDIENW